VKHSDLGKIPGHLDQVVLADVDRSKAGKIKILFVTGLNDGNFPSKPKAEGFLNDADRIILKEQGIELAKNSTDSLYEDQFNIYKVFSIAEEKLFLSFISSNKDGMALRPSVLLLKIKKIFPELRVGGGHGNPPLQPQIAFEMLLINMKKFQAGEEIDPIWFYIYDWFQKNQDWKPRLEKTLTALNWTGESERLTKENIDNLYGATPKTSVSRLEQYKKCPFSYYLKYGLKLQEKNEFKVKSIDTGSFMHEVIDEFFKRWDAVGADDSVRLDSVNILNLVNTIIQEKLNLQKNYILTASPKFVVLTNRLKKVITKSIEYIVEHIKNSDFDVLRK